MQTLYSEHGSINTSLSIDNLYGSVKMVQERWKVIRNFSNISDTVPKSMIGNNLYFLCQRCMSFQIQNNQVDDIMLKSGGPRVLILPFSKNIRR